MCKYVQEKCENSQHRTPLNRPPNALASEAGRARASLSLGADPACCHNFPNPTRRSTGGSPAPAQRPPPSFQETPLPLQRQHLLTPQRRAPVGRAAGMCARLLPSVSEEGLGALPLALCFSPVFGFYWLFSPHPTCHMALGGQLTATSCRFLPCAPAPFILPPGSAYLSIQQPMTWACPSCVQMCSKP